MKRHILFLWFLIRPSLVWLLRAVFWVVTVPIGVGFMAIWLFLALLTALSLDDTLQPVWVPCLIMDWLETIRPSFSTRIAAARQAADEAVAGFPVTESETLLRVVGGEE